MNRSAIVVASDPTMRLLLESTLSPQHWRVTRESTVAGAEAILVFVHVDLLLADLTQLRSRDVLSLCRSTRKDLGPNQTKIIAIAKPDDIDKFGGDLRRQIDVLLPKPFSPCALLDWIYATFPDERQDFRRSSAGVA